ncbi:hypothetical protein AcW1_002081 [Taiwanofungus camphoratus]|nr:hypothetical protein AcV5_010078 [Antrodia cinnamomea]KAI0944346.1 hypothetical protein AcW1_002081 [Antrodia cinnamomea]
MSLKRYTISVDGTIPVPALLYEDEDLLALQEGVGIYDGTQKSAPHQSGVIYVTTYRLFYIDAVHSNTRSFSLDLSHVAKTEHYAGLFTSSPKVTLYLNPPATPKGPGVPEQGMGTSIDLSATVNDPTFESWECGVCGYRNPPGLSPAVSRVCALCGVPRSSVKPPVDIPHKSPFLQKSHRMSTSLPSSVVNLSGPAASSSSSPASSLPHPVAAGESEVACPACTFLNHSALPSCEICGTPLPGEPAPAHLQAKSAPASRPTSAMAHRDANEEDADTPEARMIRLSFRKGGDKAFYGVLRRSLLGKGWEARGIGKGTTVDGSADSGSANATGLSGINGILRNVETTAATAQTDLDDALKDLEALMVKWKDMVRLAQDLNERLTAASSSPPSNSSSLISSSTVSSAVTNTEGGMTTMTTQAVEPEEATFIRSSLAQLGLQMTNAPVTLDMIRDERRWIEELARELAGVLQDNGGRDKHEGLMRKRGIVGLDEIWGGWNRARGVALIPPSTFLLVLPQLPNYTSPPIHMRTFQESGLSVLHTPPYTRAAFASRLVGLLTLGALPPSFLVAHQTTLMFFVAPILLSESSR